MHALGFPRRLARAGDDGRYTDMLNELRLLTICRDDVMHGIRVCIWSDSVPADPSEEGNV